MKSEHHKQFVWTTTLVVIVMMVGFTAYGQKNLTDAQGRKQGYWEKRWTNGNLKYKGNFKNDKPIGEFTRYDYRLNLAARIYYYEQGDSARAELFHPNGKLAGEGLYINQLKEGLWKYYDKAGVLASEVTYTRNVKNGPYRVYYLNGKLTRQTSYVNDSENGYRIDYYENGQKRFEGNVVDAQPDGAVIYYYDNGNPEMKGNYKHAVRDGEWKYYDEQGKNTRTLHYVLGNVVKK